MLLSYLGGINVPFWLLVHQICVFINHWISIHYLLVVCLSIIKKREIIRLFVEVISSLSGFDSFQTSTTRTNEFCFVFYEFYTLGTRLTSLQQVNTSKSVSASPMKYSGTTGMWLLTISDVPITRKEWFTKNLILTIGIKAH